MVQEIKSLPAKALLRPDEVADFFRISRNTIYAWIDSGDLKAFKVRGTIRILTVEVERVMTKKGR